MPRQSRFRLAVAISAANLAALAFARPAAAEGFALDPLDPAPAGDRFFLAPDATAVGDPRFYLMGFADYAYAPSLTVTDPVTGSKLDVVSSSLNLHAAGALSVADRVLFNVDMPFAAAQSSDAADGPAGGKPGDLRLGARLTAFGDEDDAGAFAIAADVWAPTGSEDDLTSDGKARFRPALIASGKAGSFVWAANAGYLFRKHFVAGTTETGSSFTFGLAAGLLLFDDALQIGPELQGSTQTSPQLPQAQPFQTEDTPVQGIFGARLRISDVVIGLGGGPGLSKAPGVAPRVLASIALVPTTHIEAHAGAKLASGDRDNDGVADDEDACPDKPGIATADHASNGCPEVRAAAPVDGDGDGISDDNDACPDRAGVAAADSAQNGCPAPLKDRDGDGIADDKDACPDQSGPTSDDSAQNGCPMKPKPVADRDGDGVPDGKDACPDDAGTGADGCAEKSKPTPKPAPKPAPEPPKTVAGAGVPKGQRAVASYVGFRRLDDGSSRVFVELSRPTTVLKKSEGNRVIYTLKDARVAFANNKNPLLTGEFDTPVASARLVAVGKDVDLVIELRRAATPSQHLEVRGAGASLMVDFPAH